ncbi:MAG TPA: hypothetical protein DCZ94_20730 [Lentisphaeria bacterium]|nr:MAG: hypothetical protein A2X48_09120 [Lentisphaerae bacterium GWF2_49_21]HBC89373.1 hypothetical protein [Lentisphaeria bacterium]
MKQKKKSPAPALEKGMQVLERLSKNGPQNLELLSKNLGEPKASVLRYLDTLISLGMADRDPISKEYSAKVSITRIDSAGKELSIKIQDLLDSLAEKTCRTAEWYLPNHDKMILVQRTEPDDAVIHVKAKVGFERPLDGELEAVARIAISNLRLSTAGKKYWVYRSGERKRISESLSGKMLEYDRENGFAMDVEYNPNGVRRYAVPVFYEGKFAGVVALAENFRPDADRQIPRISKMLKEAIKEI